MNNEESLADAVAMLVSLFEQNKENLEMQVSVFEQIQKLNITLQRLAEKPPVQVTTEKVSFPSIVQTEVINPVKEVSIAKPEWFTLPDFKAYFDTLSAENTKGQFAIIDMLEQILERIESIDLSKLQSPTTSYGGVITPRWYREEPSGVVNGVNRVFTLTRSPLDSSLFLFYDGLLQEPGTHYTLSRNVITYTDAPLNSNAPHIARYQMTSL